MIGKEEKQNSITATLYAGVRLWKGAEVYVNPEVAGGSGLSGALGMEKVDHQTEKHFV